MSERHSLLLFVHEYIIDNLNIKENSRVQLPRYGASTSGVVWLGNCATVSSHEDVLSAFIISFFTHCSFFSSVDCFRISLTVRVPATSSHRYPYLTSSASPCRQWKTYKIKKKVKNSLLTISKFS